MSELESLLEKQLIKALAKQDGIKKFKGNYEYHEYKYRAQQIVTTIMKREVDKLIKKYLKAEDAVTG